MLANGIFMSKLCYLIQIWGGSSNVLIRSLQVIQNQAARYTTKLSWFTPTGTLLRQCNWMSVKQLVIFHTALTVHKIVITGKPKYMFEKMCQEHRYETRRAVIYGENFLARSALAADSFCYRGTKIYNQLPLNLTETQNMDNFKIKLRKWIKSNVPLE